MIKKENTNNQQPSSIEESVLKNQIDLMLTKNISFKNFDSKNLTIKFFKL